MLIQFSVENFRSFRDKALLSMEYPLDNHETASETSSSGVLSFASIYGANASGKSNIFKAITVALLCIRNCILLQVNQPIGGIVPFMFDYDKVSQPSSFEFVFSTKGKKYIYGFSATKERIHSEYLYHAGMKRNRKIFERKNDKYFFSGSYQEKLCAFVTKTDKNKLFLSVATLWNCEETRDAYEWLQKGIDTYDQSIVQRIIPKEYFNNDVHDSLKKLALGLLKTADINLSDFDVQKIHIPDLVGGDYMRAFVTHTYYDNDGNPRTGSLDYADESEGTQYMFALIPTIKKAFEEGKTICFDEFDAHLHPILLRYLVELFSNPRYNKGNGQLIISAHSMALLGKNFLKPYQVYFVEKNRKNLSSELYSLDEFSDDRYDDVRNMYLDGRYGAVPDIWEERDDE